MASTVIDRHVQRPDLAYIRDPYHPARRHTREVMVGNVGVGGKNPVRVQSMTTTRTQDVDATTAQALRLVEAGCEIVRITAPTVSDARAIGEVRARLRAMGLGTPLAADIHFSPAAALAAAEHADKVRVNPGNFADSRKFAIREYSDSQYEDELERVAAKFSPVVRACRERGVAMRIGTNHGSLSDRVMNRFGDSPEGMVESALEFVRICESLDYHEIILSMKASNPKVMISAYRLLVARMDAEGMAYPLHLGVTEAGNGDDARIKSAAGIGSLLLDGLGDTIRVSLAEEPEAEIPVAMRIVSLCARSFAGARAEQDLAPALPYDPFAYTRRHAHPVQIGALELGDGATIAVVGQVPRHNPPTPRMLDRRALKAHRPDLLIWNLDSDDDITRLDELAWKGEGATPRPLAASSTSIDLLHEALPHVEVARLLWDGSQSESAARGLASACLERRVALWLAAELLADEPDVRVAELVSLARSLDGPEHLVILASARGRDAASVVRGTRLLAALLREAGIACPIVLEAPTDEPVMLTGAAALGSLLCDGVGDAVVSATVPLSFDLLQGAGARLTRTDYVACPSCGRTLFDLQSTTERIKVGTSHLKGVKIAIMGCVVNGPGEMADADFGYMGGSPGHVNLYVGKECVERNVPEAAADERLIALIKAHRRWIEPGTNDE
jgi:(E)-4-hydroxy-3-methylbut-2-enyl-diphosphate synthase